MKKMKKTLSLILAVIMILTAVPMQSFALFDKFYPTVEKVEITDNVPISYKYVQNNDYEDGLLLTPVYGMGGSCNYSYKIYLSNGNIIEIDDFIYSGTDLLKNGMAYITCFMYVEPDECAKAIAEGKTTVGVELSLMVQYLDFKNTFRHYYFDAEKEIVPEIVKDIRLADTMPESYDKYEPHAAFVGKKFEVEYADGRKETYTLEDHGDYNYYLGTEHVSLWHGEDSYIDETTGETVYYEGLNVDYIDANSILEKKLIPCPYERIEIIDHEFNGKGLLTSLTYKITYKDGNTLEKTRTFEDGISADEFAVIDTVDGNDIGVCYGISDYTYWLETWIGYDVWEMGAYLEGDAKDVCDCRCHRYSALDIILNIFFTRIWEIFRIKEYCQCGDWHW